MYDRDTLSYVVLSGLPRDAREAIATDIRSETPDLSSRTVALALRAADEHHKLVVPINPADRYVPSPPELAEAEAIMQDEKALEVMAFEEVLGHDLAAALAQDISRLHRSGWLSERLRRGVLSAITESLRMFPPWERTVLVNDVQKTET